jgi:hypothetical protein
MEYKICQILVLSIGVGLLAEKMTYVVFTKKPFRLQKRQLGEYTLAIGQF